MKKLLAVIVLSLSSTAYAGDTTFSLNATGGQQNLFNGTPSLGLNASVKHQINSNWSLGASAQGLRNQGGGYSGGVNAGITFRF